FRRYGKEHPFPFQFRQQFYFAVLFQRLCKTKQQDFPLLLVYDGAALEMNVGPYLLAGLQKLDGMFEFKLKVMFIGIGPEADFLDNRLLGIGFNLLLLFLLLVDKLAVVDYPADRRNRFWRNFH